MSFKEELKAIADNKLLEQIKQFADDNRESLKASAEKGYQGATFTIADRKDAHIIVRPEFISGLEKELDGCQVSIREEKKRSILNQSWTVKLLVINWGKGDFVGELNTAEKEVSNKEGN